jgi:hypothetical protein
MQTAVLTLTAVLRLTAVLVNFSIRILWQELAKDRRKWRKMLKSIKIRR